MHRSVAKQNLDLFEFASTAAAETRATATKIVGCQIIYAAPLGTPFDRIPDYVGCLVAEPYSSQRKNSALDSLARYIVWGCWKLKRKFATIP